MDKESRIELQKIDCNCNDCQFMQRDFDKFKQSVELHRKWQQNHFDAVKNNLLRRAKYWQKKGEADKAAYLRTEAQKMRFQFNRNEVTINYGFCDKLKKDVQFIPNTCQLDTQSCFKHRRNESKL